MQIREHFQFTVPKPLFYFQPSNSLSLTLKTYPSQLPTRKIIRKLSYSSAPRSKDQIKNPAGEGGGRKFAIVEARFVRYYAITSGIMQMRAERRISMRARIYNGPLARRYAPQLVSDLNRCS